ncbi:MAG: glycosyltransferase family 2 protein [Ruminiclostridium sp.]|nr:glycosyltransferase family 2 protein [Ruminiclostridium sp.]
MMTISVCMIVKNEEAQLAACLDSLKPIADEIVIVDTGSTDGTKEIAARYADRIYDFPWIDDFAAARNFAFSKATMDYIYTADADEVIDEDNIRLFRRVKELLPPETEIVQMYYLNLMEENTAYNSKRELRPKLFKRLRTFEWINPVHETVRLDPVVYNSDIEIQHLAKGSHAKRDFATFQKALKKGMRLDKVLHSMYAKELFIAGDSDDLAEAVPFFEQSLADTSRSADEQREARCVLARAYRICGNTAGFFRLCLRDVIAVPCSEMCSEIGRYFYDSGNYAEALCWLNDAIFETEAVITILSQGKDNLALLSDCYEKTGDSESAEKYRKMADEWELPETV